MSLLGFDPAVFVFWGGLAVMAGASMLVGRRPELFLRLAYLPSGSIADQAERWLQSRG